MQSFQPVSLFKLVRALSHWPCEWVQGLLQGLRFAQRRTLALARHPKADSAEQLAATISRLQASGAAAGFDLARAQYAAAVQAGLIERSLLASGAFERRLGRLERMTLGPWARTV